MIADSRRKVHTSADVWHEARRLENDSEYGARHCELYRAEALTALTNADRVNACVLGFGTASQSMTRSDINTPAGTG